MQPAPPRVTKFMLCPWQECRPDWKHMKIDRTSRSVSLDPRDPDFVNDPYTAYGELRALVPVFRWEQYGYWCFTRHADVSALLRERRFGRQILQVMSREELGWPETPPHLKPFYD